MLRCAEECDHELRGKLGHKLVPAWKRFKKRHDHTALTQFDAVVANLDRCRALRYPELPIAGDGIAMATSAEKGPRPTSTRVDEHGKQTPMTMYHLCLDELDELFGAIGPLEFSPSALQTSIEGRSGSSRRLGNSRVRFGCQPRMIAVAKERRACLSRRARQDPGCVGCSLGFSFGCSWLHPGTGRHGAAKRVQHLEFGGPVPE